MRNPALVYHIQDESAEKELIGIVNFSFLPRAGERFTLTNENELGETVSYTEFDVLRINHLASVETDPEGKKGTDFTTMPAVMVTNALTTQVNPAQTEE